MDWPGTKPSNELVVTLAPTVRTTAPNCLISKRVSLSLESTQLSTVLPGAKDRALSPVGVPGTAGRAVDQGLCQLGHSATSSGSCRCSLCPTCR